MYSSIRVASFLTQNKSSFLLGETLVKTETETLDRAGKVTLVCLVVSLGLKTNLTSVDILILSLRG